MRRLFDEEDNANEKFHKRDAEKRKKKERRQARNSKRNYE